MCVCEGSAADLLTGYVSKAADSAATESRTLAIVPDELSGLFPSYSGTQDTDDTSLSHRKETCLVGSNNN